MFWANILNAQVRYELTSSVALRVSPALFTKAIKAAVSFARAGGNLVPLSLGGVEKSHPEKQNVPKGPAEAK